MQWMYDMKIGAKLLVSFIIVALFTGVVGVVGFVNVQKLEDSNTLLYEKMTLPIAEVGQISTSYQQMRVIVRDMVIENDPALIQANADQVGVHNQEIDEAAAAFQETLIDSEMQAVFEAFMASRKALAQEFEQLKLRCHPERCDWNHESACQRRCQCRH